MASNDALSINAASPMSPARPKRGRPPKNSVPYVEDGERKPFQCGECARSFRRKSDMTRHSHVHTGERPHMCTHEGCGKQFIQTSALTVHRRVHTGEKPHSCSEIGCLKKFSDSSSLARHRRIHNKQFQCNFETCSRGTTTWDKLHDHVVKAHKAVQYVGQPWPSLRQIPTLFGYSKGSGDRKFAVPLRAVLDPETNEHRILIDFRNCQQQNTGSGELIIKKEQESSTFHSQAVVAQNPFGHLYGRDQPLSNMYPPSATDAPSLPVQSQWIGTDNLATSRIGALHTPLIQITPHFGPVPEDAGNTMNGYMISQPQGNLFASSPMSDFARPDFNLPSNQQSLPFSHSLGLLGNPSTSQSVPFVHTQPMDLGMPMPFQQTNVNPIAMSACHPDGLVEPTTQRRISETSESSFVSERSEPYADGTADVLYDHPMMHDASDFNASRQPQEVAGSYGDSEDANVPDLIDSEAQSLADEDPDYMERLVGSYDEIKIEADANGFLLPSQHFGS